MVRLVASNASLDDHCTHTHTHRYSLSVCVCVHTLCCLLGSVVVVESVEQKSKLLLAYFYCHLLLHLCDFCSLSSALFCSVSFSTSTPHIPWVLGIKTIHTIIVSYAHTNCINLFPYAWPSIYLSSSVCVFRAIKRNNEFCVFI